MFLSVFDLFLIWTMNPKLEENGFSKLLYYMSFGKWLHQLEGVTKKSGFESQLQDSKILHCDPGATANIQWDPA